MKYLFQNNWFKNKKEVDKYIKEYIFNIIFNEKIIEIKSENKHYSFFIEIVDNYNYKDLKNTIQRDEISHFTFLTNEYNNYDLHVFFNNGENIRLAINYSKFTVNKGKC